MTDPLCLPAETPTTVTPGVVARHSAGDFAGGWSVALKARRAAVGEEKTIVNEATQRIIVVVRPWFSLVHSHTTN
jgi:hypothetical protein